MKARPPRRSIAAAAGFTLMEAMVSLAVSAVMLLGALGSYTAAQRARADARHEWTAFTLAQTRLEMLASAPREHALLVDDTPDAVTELGGAADAQCESGVDHAVTTDMRVDGLGQPRADAPYTLCWKVTGGNPFGPLKNLRVVVGYPVGQERRHVLLQTIR